MSSFNHTQQTYFFFFFNDTATTEIYTLSLHDALPISARRPHRLGSQRRLARRLPQRPRRGRGAAPPRGGDRKSKRLNSSHGYISYAVFCLKKKNHCPGNPRSALLASTLRPARVLSWRT